MEYTKGNWYWNKVHGLYHGLRSLDRRGQIESDYHILFISPNFNGEESLDNEANANLISAAPDMYEALKLFIERAETHGMTPAFIQPGIRANEAIAKAEGSK